MAVVKVSYTRSRRGAKASIRYITHRPGRDGMKMSRTLWGSDGSVAKRDAYGLIDRAGKGSIFFRLAISPDPKIEDTRRDLHLRSITEATMNALEERAGREISWIAAVHADHAPHRHVHVLAIVQGRLDRSDLHALIEGATGACGQQRIERDQALKERVQAQEQTLEQWELQHEHTDDS